MSQLLTTSVQPSALVGTGGNVGTIPFTETGFASISFMIISTALVMMMSPLLGLLYSGLSGTKNAVSSFLICSLTYSVVAAQWTLFGYSLSFAEDSSSSLIGNFNWGGLRGIGVQGLSHTAPAIPAALFALFQMQIAAITPAIMFGSVCERIRFVPAMIFVFVWTTIVYDPITYWTWGARGWLRNLSCLPVDMTGTPCLIGVQDYGGGGPVEITSGFSALALALVIGARRKRYPAHSIINVNIATALLWFGWYGFNAGSAFSASPRAAMAALTTTISPIFSSLSWMSLDYYKTGKLSSLSWCSGALAGLIAITPACGFVAPWGAIIIGIFSGLLSNIACSSKNRLGYDDTMDAFGLHGVCGFFGMVMTGILSTTSTASMDGPTVLGGVVDGHPIQLQYNVVAAVAAAAWSFFLTFGLAWIFSKIPALSLRSCPEDEDAGLDETEHGEKGYEFVSAGEMGLKEGEEPHRSKMSLHIDRAKGGQGKVNPTEEVEVSNIM